MKLFTARTRRILLAMAAGAGLFGLLAAGGGLALMYSGLYNVTATEGHTAAVFWVLDTGLRRSVARHSAGVQPPDLSDPALIERGFRCFHHNCVQCHGAPGIPPDDVGKGLQPIPGNLAQTGLDWRAAEVYWVTKNGIRMAGMPAWEFRLTDRDLWAVVAFVERLPHLDAADYRELMHTIPLGPCDAPVGEPGSDARAGGGARGDPARGETALRQYACHACHIIPGIVGPDAYVGPPLERFGARTHIAGFLPNTREHLVRWIRDPQALSPHTLMPDMGVTEEHAHDMAAYLERLE